MSYEDETPNASPDDKKRQALDFLKCVEREAPHQFHYPCLEYLLKSMLFVILELSLLGYLGSCFFKPPEEFGPLKYPGWVAIMFGFIVLNSLVIKVGNDTAEAIMPTADALCARVIGPPILWLKKCVKCVRPCSSSPPA